MDDTFGPNPNSKIDVSKLHDLSLDDDFSPLEETSDEVAAPVQKVPQTVKNQHRTLSESLSDSLPSTPQ